MTQKPELVAPAGNMECARAAIANGADAIYFGMPRFNARMRADNFTAEQLPELVRFAHEHEIRVFTGFNTLLFTHELAEAEKQLILLDEAGVDAIIVQDLGLARLSKRLHLRLAIHGSTQMTITSPEGVEFVRRLGLERVVLAREISLRELEKFDIDKGLSVEVFVHGALCVSYSGQCLTSEVFGQRSANRGECAQACRLPYDLIINGVLKDLGDRRYLLSPQDLAAVREIPELLRLGVRGFKIEGRLKTPEYVAATTQVYRKAIDAVLKGDASSTPSQDDLYKLEMTFSRGLFSGWMHGVNHQKLVHARYGKKRGAFVGFIKQVERDFVRMNCQIPIRPGDGLVFDAGGDTEKEQGGRLYEMRGDRLFFKYGHIDFSKLKIGDRVWKTDDPQINKLLRNSFEKKIPTPKSLIHMRVTGKRGDFFQLSAIGPRGEAHATSNIPLQQALKHPLTSESLRNQLGRLGDTPFVLGDLDNQLQDSLILPISELNRLRREVVRTLEKTQRPALEEKRPSICPSLTPMLKRIFAKRTTPSSSDIEWVVLCRVMDQVDIALKENIHTLYLDFEDIRRYPEAVARIRKTPDVQVFLATPRIQKAGERGFFKWIENAKADGILIRNVGALDYFKNSSLRKIGDFSLNIANPLTADLLMRQGMDRLSVSYDLNAEQVLDLLNASPAEWFELTIHQHMPMFHMEHCVFAAFLSKGTDHTNCGRPCDHHQVKLRDRMGVEHPLKADVGCRNTLFHAKPQSGINYLKSFYDAGARVFRIELLNENALQTQTILRAYNEITKSNLSDASALIRRLNVVKQLGVTNGTLTVLSPAKTQTVN